MANSTETLKQNGADQVLFEWESPEFIHYEKDQRWFMIAGVLMLGLIVYGLIWGSAFLALAVIILTAVYYLQHKKEPRQIKIQILEMGVRRDGKFYPYSGMRSFWMVYNPPEVSTLHFSNIKGVNTEIVIQLDNLNPAPIREYLARQLPEDEGRGENFVDMLVRVFKL